MSPHSVAVLAIPEVLPMEAGMPFQILQGINSSLDYAVTLCAKEAQIRTTGGFHLSCNGDLASVAQADTVIIPAFWPIDQEIDPEILEALQKAHNRGARLVSICLGAFALGAAGLLDNHKATTHWRYTKILSTRYPLVDVKNNVLFVDAGKIITSAGVASGIDICLYLIELDYGHIIAEEIAQSLVVTQRRYGESLQYYPLISSNSYSIDQAKKWALDNIAAPLKVADFARFTHMSERSFSRNFIDQTGMTPMKWLNRARIKQATFLLQTTDMNIDLIAHQSGLGSATNLRRQLKSELGVNPTVYRKSILKDETQVNDK